MAILPKQISTILIFLLCNFSVASTSAAEVTDQNLSKNRTEVEILIKRSKDMKGIHPSESLSAAEDALALAKKIDDTLSVVNALNELGRVYNYMEYTEKALDVLQKAADLSEKSNLKKELSDAYNEMGGVFYNQADFKMAGKYFTKSLDIRLFLGDDQGSIAGALNNVGESYRLMGDKKTALEYYFRAKVINEKLGHKRFISINCANIGYIYLSEDNFPKALEYFKLQYETALSGEDKKDLASPLNNLGLYYLKTGDFNKAVEYYSKGLQAAKEVYQRLDQMDAVKGLSDAYAKLGDHKKAYEYLSEFTWKKDSVQNADKEGKLLEMDLKFETMDKEKQIQKLEDEKKISDLNESQQKMLIYSLLGGVIFLAILAVVLFYANRQRKKYKNFG